MRLPALLVAAVLGGPSVVTLHAQAVLPSRSFDLAPAIRTNVPDPPINGWWQNGGPRVRPVGPRVAALLRAGLDRSSVVRDLVSRVEASDVIVYVEINPRIDRRLAGCITFVGNGGSFRYLRAMLNPDLSLEPLIASLAHELHHVVEVVDAPQVRSEAALTSLYRRIGFASRGASGMGWETEAARQVTGAVRDELERGTGVILARSETAEQEPERERYP